MTDAHARTPAAPAARCPDPRGRRHRLQRLLVDWYRAEGRTLAWRRTRDPYRILVSEIMLQQTQAARVEPAYEAFLERFPTVQALACASAADVLRAWRGLGYNRRAVHLQRAAAAIVQRHGGTVPPDLDALLALPGVGGYTARAVLAFAFGKDAAPVDTNVTRVLARAVAGRALGRRQAQDLAEQMVPVDCGPLWSHALMDLGARYCTARSPRCATCPVASACAWRLQGGPAAQEPLLAAPVVGRADPATAGRPRPQGRFAGSDRFHRGRLVDALRAGPVACHDLAAVAGLDDETRLAALTAALVAEGLAERSGDALRLPVSAAEV